MSAVPEPHRGRRTSDQIADDARAIRAAMDRTLDEIEYRLSPGQLSSGTVDMVRDVLRGGNGPVPHAIRSNPLPVILIGVGFLWLAWQASRAPHIDARRVYEPEEEPSISSQRIRILLTGLIGATRQGAERFRRAEGVIGDPVLGLPLRRCAERMEAAGDALTAELARRGSTIEPDAPPHPVWQAFDALPIKGADHRVLFQSLADGLDATFALARDSLHEPLPAPLRVAVGSEFHELEILRHEVAALREAVA